MTEARRLDDESIEAVARRVAELLQITPTPAAGGPLLSAAEVASRLGVSRDLVYRRADQLGAVRLGTSVRFRLADVQRGLNARSGSEQSLTPEPRLRKGRRKRQTPPRLPVRGSHPDD